MIDSNFDDLLKKLEAAFNNRKELLQDPTLTAIRLFNGFLEGDPRWVIELFRETLVINDHRNPSDPESNDVTKIVRSFLERLPQLKAILYKQRYAKDQKLRNGIIILGDQLTKQINEFGILHQVELTINQDSSLYLDTRNLRIWLRENMNRKSVINTFAYTGSLGVAALAGGAKKVVQVDLNRKFLEVSLKSCALNKLSTNHMKLITDDFYRAVGNFKKSNQLFDCAIIDPPFYSKTTSGTVDLVNESTRIINKIRPLVAHDGYLVVVNNALFLSGKELMDQLNDLCHEGYMSIDQIIPVPLDVIGYPETIVTSPPVEVAPFNYSTKIVILKVNRKDKRTS